MPGGGAYCGRAYACGRACEDNAGVSSAPPPRRRRLPPPGARPAPTYAAVHPRRRRLPPPMAWRRAWCAASARTRRAPRAAGRRRRRRARAAARRRRAAEAGGGARRAPAGRGAGSRRRRPGAGARRGGVVPSGGCERGERREGGIDAAPQPPRCGRAAGAARRAPAPSRGRARRAIDVAAAGHAPSSLQTHEELRPAPDQLVLGRRAERLQRVEQEGRARRRAARAGTRRWPSGGAPPAAAPGPARRPMWSVPAAPQAPVLRRHARLRRQPLKRRRRLERRRGVVGNRLSSRRDAFVGGSRNGMLLSSTSARHPPPGAGAAAARRVEADRVVVDGAHRIDERVELRLVMGAAARGPQYGRSAASWPSSAGSDASGGSGSSSVAAQRESASACWKTCQRETTPLLVAPNCRSFGGETAGSYPKREEVGSARHRPRSSRRSAGCSAPRWRAAHSSRVVRSVATVVGGIDGVVARRQRASAAASASTCCWAGACSGDAGRSCRAGGGGRRGGRRRRARSCRRTRGGRKQRAGRVQLHGRLAGANRWG